MTHHQPPHGDSFWPASLPNDQGSFNRGGNDNPFFDFFRPQPPGQGPHEAAAHWPVHHHSRGAAHETAHHHLPHLSITGDGHAHHGTKSRHTADSNATTDGQPDAGLGSWGQVGSSSEAIAQAAANSVGHHSYQPRPGSQFYGEHLAASLGCTSASTNMFFDGLKAAGKVSDKDYRRLHQVSNDAAYVGLQHLGIAKPVNGRELKPGDWAYFKNPGQKHGHSGVVFEGNNGQLMVANNHVGTTVATPLSTLMHHYSSVRGLRADV